MRALQHREIGNRLLWIVSDSLLRREPGGFGEPAEFSTLVSFRVLPRS